MKDRIRADESLSAQLRADQLSAMNTFARLMGQMPEAMPAKVSVYRPRLRRLTPAVTGLSAKRLANIKSSVLRAIDRYGGRPRRHALGEITPEWRAVTDRLTVYQRANVSRFISWCSAVGIEPPQVSDAVMAQFQKDLIAESFVAKPTERVAAICREWQRMRAAMPELSLPTVSIPRNRQTYVLKDTAFPSSFIADRDRFCIHLGGSEPFSEDGPPRPLKPVSVKRRHFQIMQLASGLVHSGTPAAEIRSLRDLVAPASLRDSLKYFLMRAGGATTTQISQLAYVAKIIARHWVSCEPQTLRHIEHIAAKVAMRQRGLTSKNRERLRQFDDTEHLRRILFFADDLMDELRRTDDGRVRIALKAQIAAAVTLLIAAPIRLANLASLRLDIHIQRSRTSDDAVWHLVLAEHETKNQEPREHPLGAEAVFVLREYLDRYRPRIASPGNDHIFPSGAGHKATNSLGTAISRLIFERTGLQMNAHLFRHFAAKLILEATPGAYGIVQDVLGHRDAATTRGHYAGSETAAAARHFSGVVHRTRTALRRGNGSGR
jgi:integrase